MAKISKKQVLSGPSFSSESLLAWVDSIAKENRRKSEEDEISVTDLKRLKDICTDPLVRIRLKKILKGVTDAEGKAQSFLLSVCRERLWTFQSKIQSTPSLRARELSKIAKAAHALASRVYWNRMGGIIDFGTDHVDFVTKHMNDPKAIFPPHDAAYRFDYEELYGIYDGEPDENNFPSPKLLENLLHSFGDVLQGQAKHLLSGAATLPGTPIRHYIDSLIKLCKTEIGVADALLIKHVAAVVTEQNVSRPSIDYRIKKLS